MHDRMRNKLCMQRVRWWRRRQMQSHDEIETKYTLMGGVDFAINPRKENKKYKIEWK